MTLENLSALLGWSCLLNYLVLLIWFAFFSIGHDWIYRLHSRFFNLRLESFDAVHYGLMGIYKLGIFLFNLMPWLILQFIN